MTNFKLIRCISVLCYFLWVPNITLAAGDVSNENEIKNVVQNYIGGRLAVSPSEIEVRVLGEIGDGQKNMGPSNHLTVREANGTNLLGNAMFLLESDDPSHKYAPVWINVRT